MNEKLTKYIEDLIDIDIMNLSQVITDNRKSLTDQEFHRYLFNFRTAVEAKMEIEHLKK